jgi:hypothetical protein
MRIRRAIELVALFGVLPVAASAWPGPVPVLVLSRVLVVYAALTYLALLLVPHELFGFVRARPGFWAVVMCLYPLLSAYPQTIVYRAFVFHRYRCLVGEGLGMVRGVRAGARGAAQRGRGFVYVRRRPDFRADVSTDGFTRRVVDGARAAGDVRVYDRAGTVFLRGVRRGGAVVALRTWRGGPAVTARTGPVSALTDAVLRDSRSIRMARCVC